MVRLGPLPNALYLLGEGHRALTTGHYGRARRPARRVLGNLDGVAAPRGVAGRLRRSALDVTARAGAALVDLDDCALALTRMLASLPHEPRRPADVRRVVDALTRLGTVRRLQAHYPEAERLLGRAVALAESHPRTRRGAGPLTALAITYKDTGRYDRAEEIYRSVFSRIVDAGGGDTADAASCLHNLAGLAHARGDAADAEPLARRALRIRTELVGRDHPDTAADLAVLGAVLIELGRHADAEDAYRRAHAVYLEAFGPNHYEVAVCLIGLATIDLDHGDRARAAARYREALSIKERVLGPGHPEVRRLRGHLALARQVPIAARPPRPAAAALSAL